MNREKYFGKDAPLVDLAEFPSWIIYEDEHFLVLNKPGWLVCHPSKNGPLSSLVGAAREYLGLDSVHLVNRLDRETSGVTVIAKDRDSASTAQKALDAGKVRKSYMALLRGRMEGTRTISQPLADDKDSIVSIKTCCAMRKPSAKNAITIFTPVAYSESGEFEPATLARVEILTGRKHQIRAHALWAGHQVVGDKLYGPDEGLYLDFIERGYDEEMSKILPMARQGLHAYEMDFGQVLGGLKFRASLPEDFLDFMRTRKIAFDE